MVLAIRWHARFASSLDSGFDCFTGAHPCRYLSTKATLPTVAHVVTQNDIIFFVEPTGPCSCCFTGGKDAKVTPLKLIQSVGADNAESGACICATCCVQWL